MKKIVMDVKQILENRGMNIIQNYEKDDNMIFLTDGAIIIISPKTKTINLSLHVSCRPDEAGILTLEFHNLKYKLQISQPFIYGEKGELIQGDEAIDKLETNFKNDILSKFIREQQELYMLHTVEPNGPTSIC